jgi:HAD superfamily hydrolase (TIGR01509 family)
VQRLLIFDFDGVIADSEVLANKVLAEMVTELGVSTSLEDSYHRYMGKRFTEVIAAVETSLATKLPEDFPARYQAQTLARFRAELRAVDGAHAYLDAFAHVPRCIASSSSPDRLSLCLEVLRLEATFGPHVFSASSVARGKPHPDIFLYAADMMGVSPSQAIVIEDSAAGVQAGVAAGMTVIGLLAASHIQSGHRERLRAAGAHHVASTFAEVERITRELLAAE